jgi:hypothetical protein
LSIGFSAFIPEHQLELSNDYLTVLYGRYEANHDNGTVSLFAPSLYRVHFGHFPLSDLMEQSFPLELNGL